MILTGMTKNRKKTLNIQKNNQKKQQNKYLTMQPHIFKKFGEAITLEKYLVIIYK